MCLYCKASQCFKELTRLRRRKPKKSAAIFSPIELDLIDQSILEYRSFTEPEDYRGLEKLNAKSVMKSIIADKISFVLYWSNGKHLNFSLLITL